MTPDDARPVDDLYALAYDELRRRAASVRRSDPFAAISTRTLVHETWLKFSKSTTIRFESEKHLIDIVVRAMRQVLVDLARYRRAGRRTGIVISIDDASPIAASSPADDALAIDEAITNLEKLDPTAASIVQMHYFGGYSLVEIAGHLGLSESTARRKCDAALARLKVALELGE